MASIDRFDTHSVSQESTSDHHNQGLEDLTDEQIQNQIDEILRVNQMLTIENQIFDKYYKKIEPFFLATIAGTSSSSLTTTPSGSMYDLSGGQQQQPSTGGRYRKRSKSRSTQGDFRMRLTADQKCDIASKEIDELREESRKANEESEKNLDSYKAILEEADLRINEIKIEMHEFERDVLKAGFNPLNKKIVAEKLLKYFDDRMKERDTLIDKLKLKNESMRKRRQKLKAELKEKEEMGEVLHEVDFRQLKIENKQYMAKIDEKNTEMIKLKKMVGLVTQTLNFRKKQLNQYLKEYDSILNDIKSREKLLNNIETETKTVRTEHSKEETKNRKLRGQLENYKVPEVSDYVNAEDYLYNLQKELKVWERKVEIAEMALKINKQSWIQIKSDASEAIGFGQKQFNNNSNNQLSNSAF
ncbi:unnamed protein product [Brachionus calyciflorus]|uniref:Cilia- and flagella-associated protein 263 n=1 Tax=Brachionus calyciflorus TaxID=104777 RepID=A0A813M7L7_9BILA|nr:unnamed protein product [Brachionus calyciflorus]